MKSISARCGHVKRRLNQGQPLEGELLEFALDIVEGGIVKEGIGNSNDELLRGIAKKLRAGEELGDYEHHVMVDVILLHVRLGSTQAQ